MKIFNIVSTTNDTSVEVKQNINLELKKSNENKELNDDEISLNFVYKTKMDLIVNAPLIIIPQNSKSKNAVLIDCGKISTETSLLITREYNQSNDTKRRCLENKNKYTIPPIIEQQTIKLLDVKILKLVSFLFDLVLFFKYCFY